MLQLNQRRMIDMNRIEKIISIVKKAGEMTIPADMEITPDMNIASDLRLDSLDMVAVVSEIEEEFGIEIDNDEVQSIRTINDINDKIESLLG